MWMHVLSYQALRIFIAVLHRVSTLPSFSPRFHLNQSGIYRHLQQVRQHTYMKSNGSTLNDGGTLTEARNWIEMDGDYDGS